MHADSPHERSSAGWLILGCGLVGLVGLLGLVGMVMGFGMFTFTTMSPSPTPPPPVEEGELAADPGIRQVLDDQVRAWNRGDLDDFMKGYWNSPDLTFFSGKDRRQGWQETMERYKKRYQGEGKQMGRLAFDEIDVRMLTADDALVRGRWQLTLDKDVKGGLFTLHFRRLPEGWRIVHDHTSTE